MGPHGDLVEGLVPAETFFDALRDHAEDLGEVYYIPPIDFRASSALLSVLRSNAVKPITGERLRQSTASR